MEASWAAVLVNYREPDRVDAALYAFREFVRRRVRAVVVDNSAGGVDFNTTAGDVFIIQNQRNLGYAAAINQAMDLVEANFILLLNPDVSGWHGSVDSIAEAFKDSSVVAVSPRLRDESGAVQHSCRRAPRPFDFLSETLALAARFPRWSRPRRLRMLDWDYADERDVDAVTGACLFLRRSAFERVGPFDERFFVYGEEIDWLVRAQQLGYRTRYLPSVEVTHIGSASTPASRPVLDRLLIESHYRYIGKHFGRATELALRAALFTLDALRVARHPTAARDLIARMRVHLGIKYERPA